MVEQSVISYWKYHFITKGVLFCFSYFSAENHFQVAFFLLITNTSLDLLWLRKIRSKETSFDEHEEEANLGHANLAQEIGDDNSTAEHKGKESVLKRSEIKGDILVWRRTKFGRLVELSVQALVKSEESDSNWNLPAR